MSRSWLSFRSPAVVAAVCGLVLLSVETGCGRPPQVTSHNREIIVALATAVSTRNREWLEANARMIEQRRADGQLSAAEYGSLSAILAKARGGDWKAAEADVYALRDAQEPTAEDFQNVAARKLAPEHQLPKTAAKGASQASKPRQR
jgi:hypothetical protein